MKLSKLRAASVIEMGAFIHSSRWLVVIATIMVGIVAVAGFANETLLIDDASIVLVYAHHLTTGQGLVWNDTPVEGFTSALDLMIKSIGTLLFEDPIEMNFWTALGLHIACPLLAMRIIYVAHGRGGGHFRTVLGWSLAAGIAVAGSDALAYGSTFLLKTPLFTLLGLALVYTMLAEPATRRACMGLGFCTAAIAWTRPEGILLGLVAITVFFHRHRRQLPPGRFLTTLSLFAFPTAGLLVFRRLYFGYWVPNTYYAKSSDSRWTEIEQGVLYLVQGSDSILGILLILLSVFGWLMVSARGWKDETSRGVARMTACLASVSVFAVVAGGGDSYPDTRFLTLPFTLSILLLALAATRMRSIPRALAVNGLAAVILLQSTTLAGTVGTTLPRIGGWPLALSDFECDRSFAEWLLTAAPDLGIAQSDFQRLKLFADELEVIDLRGLNDEHIAHLSWEGGNRWGKFNHDVGVSVNAPIWLWGRRLRTEIPITDYPMTDLLHRRELLDYFTNWTSLPVVGFTDAGLAMRASYTPASVQICGEYYNLLARNDIASRLADAGTLVGHELLKD